MMDTSSESKMNLVRYSAAYPTGRERMHEHRYDAPEKLCFGGEPRRMASPKGPQGAARELIVK